MLRSLDLGKRLDHSEYRKRLLDCQLRLQELAFQLYREKRSVVIVMEGWDAAGKGGAIRRLTEKIDPRGYEVFPIAAPKEDAQARHYLWRFWNRLMPPDEKQMLIFDRSWYGRVTVERVEGFAAPNEWKRAYREILDFERQLVEHGMTVVKLWFHISADEQLKRFEARRQTPHKAWKLTEEDWRNREKWADYEEAVSEMLVKTSTTIAPWNLIEANDKLWARVRAQESVIDALEQGTDDE